VCRREAGSLCRVCRRGRRLRRPASRASRARWGCNPTCRQAAAPQRYARPAYLRGEHREYAEAEERAAVCEERALAGHDVSLHQVQALLRAAAEGTAARGMLGLARRDVRQQRAECEARHLAEGVPH